MTNPLHETEKEVKEIGEYLGCNENELWSEMEKLFKKRDTHLLEQLLKEIGEDTEIDCIPEYKLCDKCSYNEGVNQERQRIRDLLTSRLHITKE